MLDIETFDNLRGGNVVYKALAHPVAADRLADLAAMLNQRGQVAIYDPDGMAPTLLALSPQFNVEGVYVHDSRVAGHVRGTKAIQIACSGSVSFYISQHFERDTLRSAGEGGYVLIKDTTCRLFGFHGLDDRAGKFSFDQMFGF